MNGSDLRRRMSNPNIKNVQFVFLNKQNKAKLNIKIRSLLLSKSSPAPSSSVTIYYFNMVDVELTQLNCK